MIATETLDRMKQELEDADGVEADRIELVAEEDAIVLRGSVANSEQATRAQMLVEAHAPHPVRNQLRVDPALRATGQETDPGPHPLREEPWTGSDVAPPSAETFDQTTDVQEALDDSRPLDPPDAPVAAPTTGESRGLPARDTAVPPSAPTGEAADAGDGEPSAADLSQAELSRSARPESGTRGPEEA